MTRIYIKLENVPEDKVESRITAGRTAGEYDAVTKICYDSRTKYLEIWGVKNEN